MKHQTQKDRVWKKLCDDGEIDNLWAIEHYMLRLGALIKVLRDEGKEIDGCFIPGTKNFRYTIDLVKRPKKIVGWDTSTGLARPIYG